MKHTLIKEEDYFSVSFVLSRVLTSGVIMSIEKNENELKGLEKGIRKVTKTKYVSLFNSYTGAIHAALWGQDLVRGSSTRIDRASERERKFLRWLGVELVSDETVRLGYERVSIDWDHLNEIEELVNSKIDRSPVLVLDFTPLGFGPCAAIVTDDTLVWKKAERLKIFGAFDLKTMWTQEESDPQIQPAIQFNYRLSPLIAACVKLSLLRRNRGNEDRLYPKTAPIPN